MSVKNSSSVKFASHCNRCPHRMPLRACLCLKCLTSLKSLLSVPYLLTIKALHVLAVLSFVLAYVKSLPSLKRVYSAQHTSSSLFSSSPSRSAAAAISNSLQGFQHVLNLSPSDSVLHTAQAKVLIPFLPLVLCRS